MSGAYPWKVCCLNGGLPALRFKACWVGSSVDAKMSVPRGVHADECFWSVGHQCLCPQGEPQPYTPTLPGDPPRPAGRSVSDSYQITACALGPRAHEILWMYFKSEASIFPDLFPCNQVLQACNQVLQAFKAKRSRGFHFLCLTPSQVGLSWG